jgi:hypothetical protein
MGGNQPIEHPATSILTYTKAVSIVPSGGNKMDVRRENTDVRLVGFHPVLDLHLNFEIALFSKIRTVSSSV